MDLSSLDPKTAMLLSAALLAAKLLSARFPVLGGLLALLTPRPLPATPPATPAGPVAPARSPDLPRLRAIRDALDRLLADKGREAAQIDIQAEALERLVKENAPFDGTRMGG